MSLIGRAQHATCLHKGIIHKSLYIMYCTSLYYIVDFFFPWMGFPDYRGKN